MSQNMSKHEDSRAAIPAGAENSKMPPRPRVPVAESSGPQRRPRRRPAGGATARKEDLFTLNNRELHAALGALTGGVSPASVMLAAIDWGWHLAMSPGKQVDDVLEEHLHSYHPKGSAENPLMYVRKVI